MTLSNRTEGAPGFPRIWEPGGSIRYQQTGIFDFLILSCYRRHDAQRRVAGLEQVEDILYGDRLGACYFGENSMKCADFQRIVKRDRD